MSVNAANEFRTGQSYRVMFETLARMEEQKRLADATDFDIIQITEHYYRRDPYRGSLTDLFL